MYKLFFIFCLIGILFIQRSTAQHRVTIYAYVSSGYTGYRYLKKVLPDSLKEKIIIDYRKGYKIKGDEATIYRMERDGWHVSFMSSYGGGFNGNSTVSTQFVLTREISLSDEAFNQYNRLMEEKDE